MARKPDDYWTISLCQEHHSEQHAIGEGPFEDKHKIDMRELATEFANASPKKMEIRNLRYGD